MIAAMDGGDALSNGSTELVVNETGEASLITESLSSLSLNGDRKPAKDPTKIARKYQIDLCKKAVDENVIVYLGTGCGKTHIAVLLMHEMRHLIKKPQKNICIFLAPTVALVQQQAKVIEESIDLKVGMYCGSSKRFKCHRVWEKEIEQYEVFVMTPQILLHNLSHCYFKMELIALLIFDECHYAQLESNHPYAEIMKVHYKADIAKLPRIFGMTASPILGKGTSVDSLESILRAKVYSVEDKVELEQFVASPKVNICYYDRVINNSSCPNLIYTVKLEEVKHQCLTHLLSKIDDRETIKKIKKALKGLHDNLLFCLESLGLWGALQASRVLLKGDHIEREEFTEAIENFSDNSWCDLYLKEAASLFSSSCIKDELRYDLASVEVLEDPFFSKKLVRLIGILSNFRLQPNMKCIIFVNRIVTARSLSYVLGKLKFLSSWKCDFLVGVHSGLKSMSRKNTNIILEKFRSGELNLLVATKVGEEGLDIQTCCLVIRFDLPETVSSFIQSRGRARMPQSEYAFLVDRGNHKEQSLIEHFTKEEYKMNAEISSRKSRATTTDFEEKIYRVEHTGATISSVSSISLLHRYCAKLPHDEYFQPKPQFFSFDDVDGMVCHITLPSNAPIRSIISSPQPSLETAKRDACLEACKALHKIGALTDYLLPEQYACDADVSDDVSDSDIFDDEDSRKELHEMLVPNILKQPWTDLENNSVSFHCYYIKFCPNPPDRDYKEFGLFLKEPLPLEAENMKLDLHLARGRSVTTEFIPSGVANFSKEEVVQAEKFQKMSLKVIIDRSKFIPEFVSLENDEDIISATSTFYLLLPLILRENNEVFTDWKLIRRCLLSPIFGKNSRENRIVSGNDYLQLANGPTKIDDIVNSLVYVACKNTYYFVSDIVSENNGYSSFKDDKSHVEHYLERFKIELQYPEQPVLKAKQLFILENLLRKKGHKESREKEEHFAELPPEICELKIIGFSKDIGSSYSLLPSIMHRVESLLVAIELKDRLSASFPEGAQVTANCVLEALTTEKCNEKFSLERLEVLGDAFLKFAVGRHLFLKHDSLDEGQLTRKRSNIVNNSNLLRLALKNNLQVYIRDQPFEPDNFYVLGRPCELICDKEMEKSIHCTDETVITNTCSGEIRCNKCHHWLYKKTIADVVEGLIGAFLVDSGFKAAIAFLKWIDIHVDFTEEQVNNICSQSTIFTPLSNHINIPSVETSLRYHFLHKGLLIQAFVHPSFNNPWGCYQRLEFLGDAVLDYLMTSYLYSVYPKLKPGQLTDLRSALVSNNTFADIAVRFFFNKRIICDSSGLSDSINKYVSFIGKSKQDTDIDTDDLIEEPHCPKALGDLVESCIGAILLDTGFDLNCVWRVIMSMLDPVKTFSKMQLNPARELQELCQSCGWDLQFSQIRNDGKYSVETKLVKGVNDFVVASAINRSIKAAKRMGSLQILTTMKELGHKPKSKPLSEVLKKSKKMEAKLIGYDEKPSSITPIVLEASETTSQVVELLHSNLITTSFTPAQDSPSTSTSEEAPKSQLKDMMNNNDKNTLESQATVTIDDEKPLNITDMLQELKIEEASKICSDLTNGKSALVNSPSRSDNNNALYSEASVTSSTNSISSDSKPSKTSKTTTTAKSCLHELCVANCWKPPIFECCKETGPSHLRQFTYIVKIVMEEASDGIMECYGEPRAKKKDAAEHAAEGALWYLKKIGYHND